jgi:hypothetical protein
MKGITKTSRSNNALQVIQHMSAGMSVVDACRLVGMPRDFAEMKSQFLPPRCGGTS